MSQLASAPPAQEVPAGTRWCEDCGYSLRGLPPDRPCPECGHARRAEPRGEATPHRTWSRCVALGLALLLFVTLDATSTVLIQPSPDALGGTGPALNLPGPKLWAVPLLQRPIGNRPELPGVVGTRTALLSLLAIWLITTPAGIVRPGHDHVLRAATRWVSVVTFGLAFGLLMAAQGLWPSQLPPYRLLLVGAVELPGTALFYAYLRRLSSHVPGQTRRRAFDMLVWLVPVTMAGGAALLGLQWLRSATSSNAPRPGDAISLAWSGAYGVLTASCGIAATAGVGSLAVAFILQAFPSASRLPGAGRHLWRRTRRSVSTAVMHPDSAARLGRVAVATGLFLLLATMVVGNEHLLWLEARQGFGGNLPFLSYPGPKVWVAATGMALDRNYGSYSYDVLVSRCGLMFLNIVSVWLLTWRAADVTGGRLRTGVRWLSVASFGAGAGWIMVTKGNRAYGHGPDAAPSLSVIFCALTILFECPATVLLYAYLGGMARRVRMPRLAIGFYVLGGVVCLFVAAGAGMFALSREFYTTRASMPVLALGAGYGAAGLVAAAWASAAVLTLAIAVLRNRPADAAADENAERSARIT